MANKDAYTKLKVGTKAFNQAMTKMGQCMKKGGYVDLHHFMEFTQDKNGHAVRTDYANLVLNWP
jgi:hypothetical protein